jgi:MFS family permease
VKLPETRVAGKRAPAHGFLGLRAWKKALAYGNVPALLVIALVFTFGFSMMESALALFVEHSFVDKALLHTPAGQAQATKLTTWLLLAVGITAVIVQGGLIKRLRKLSGEKPLIIVGCALIAVSFVALGLVPGVGGYGLMFPVVVALSFGSGIFSPSQSSLLSRSVTGEEQGEILGLGQSMSALGRIFGPLSAGVLFEMAHGVPFFVGAVLIALGAVVATTLKPAS